MGWVTSSILAPRLVVGAAPQLAQEQLGAFEQRPGLGHLTYLVRSRSEPGWQDRAPGRERSAVRYRHPMPKLSASERANLPDSAFAYIDPLGRRRLPIHDEPHVRNALDASSEWRSTTMRRGSGPASVC